MHILSNLFVWVKVVLCIHTIMWFECNVHWCLDRPSRYVFEIPKKAWRRNWIVRPWLLRLGLLYWALCVFQFFPSLSWVFARIFEQNQEQKQKFMCGVSAWVGCSVCFQNISLSKCLLISMQTNNSQNLLPKKKSLIVNLYICVTIYPLKQYLASSLRTALSQQAFFAVERVVAFVGQTILGQILNADPSILRKKSLLYSCMAFQGTGILLYHWFFYQQYLSWW